MDSNAVTEQVRAIRQALLEGHTYDIPAVKAACDKLDELAKAPAPADKPTFTPTTKPSRAATNDG